MIAMIDYRIPTLFDQRSMTLAVVLSFMALLVSPLCPLHRRFREGLTAFYLPAIFIWWYLFQFKLMSLDPHVVNYLSPSSHFKWMMNSYICYAFGFGFSLGLLRLARGWPRAVGLTFAGVFLLLILGGQTFGPAIQQT